ncbi:hypothetical protein M0804_009148 [Polistes exclamans]|nr:hypothetical protein M0804_009148 [Polistes exclamans]
MINIGQKLTDCSIAACQELCQIPFYDISKKTQKLLLFLLMRSMKSSSISIGSILDMSHETYAGVGMKKIQYLFLNFNNLYIHITILVRIMISVNTKGFLFLHGLQKFMNIDIDVK